MISESVECSRVSGEVGWWGHTDGRTGSLPHTQREKKYRRLHDGRDDKIAGKNQPTIRYYNNF